MLLFLSSKDKNNLSLKSSLCYSSFHIKRPAVNVGKARSDDAAEVHCELCSIFLFWRTHERNHS